MEACEAAYVSMLAVKTNNKGKYCSKALVVVYLIGQQEITQRIDNGGRRL